MNLTNINLFDPVTALTVRISEVTLGISAVNSQLFLQVTNL